MFTLWKRQIDPVFRGDKYKRKFVELVSSPKQRAYYKFIKKNIKIELKEGERIPKHYGVAYMLPNRFTAVVYPVPLNLAVAVVRRVYLFLSNPTSLYRSGYDKGYSKGLKIGKDYAFNQYKNQVARKEIRNIIYAYQMAEAGAKIGANNGKNIDGWILDFIEKMIKEEYTQDK